MSNLILLSVCTMRALFEQSTDYLCVPFYTNILEMMGTKGQLVLCSQDKQKWQRPTDNYLLTHMRANSARQISSYTYSLGFVWLPQHAKLFCDLEPIHSLPFDCLVSFHLWVSGPCHCSDFSLNVTFKKLSYLK